MLIQRNIGLSKRVNIKLTGMNQFPTKKLYSYTDKELLNLVCK